MPDHLLTVSYYQASDGPRLVIFGSLNADFESFQKLLLLLDECPNESIDLTRQAFVKVSGNITLRMLGSEAISQKRGGVSLSLRKIESHPAVVFEWRMSSEEWNEVAELIVPFLQSSTACHQYLNRSSADEAIIVLSKGEYDL